MSENTEPKPDKPDIRFAVTITGGTSRYDDGHGFRHFTATAYVLGVDKYGKRQRPELLSCDDYSVADRDRTGALKGLQITAQADNDSMKRRDGQEWYAWEVSYDRFGGIQLKDAEEMLPVLRKIRKRMDKLTAEIGYPRTLAQFCAYAVKAITPERNVFMRKVPDASDYEGHGYRSMDVSALEYHLQSDAQDWRKEHGVELDD